jgi:flagellin
VGDPSGKEAVWETHIGDTNMSLNISTNTAALRAGAYLSSNNALLQRSFDRLASGKKLTTPVEDPGGLAVSMKLSSAINRVTGAQNNVQNAISFLEVQDGMLDTVGKIIDRMSELKGLASADPMKSTQDKASYNNEFKDLQAQLYDISQMKFNGVSLFASVTDTDGDAVFGAEDQLTDKDNTMTIYTSSEGSAGSKVSLNRSLLLSSLTFSTSGTMGSVKYADASNTSQTDAETGDFNMTLATESGGTFLNLQDISVGVLTKALENVSFLRAQNGGTQSRLTFNLDSLGQQKTNMRAALGRIVDVDIAEESTNLAKYSILNQAAASMLAQANASSDVALMLLR